MPNPSFMEMVLIVLGGAIMFYVVLRAIGQSAAVVAGEAIAQRREDAARRRAADAAAEAFGRAAALEPLATNPDGSIAEPILGMVEEQS